MNDRVFKDVFLDPKDKFLLKGFLESILKVKIHRIIIQNIELYEGNVHLRRKHLDSLLDTNEGVINIEVNTSTCYQTVIRNFAFLAKIYANHTLRGEKYQSKSKFIQINLNYHSRDKEYCRVYHMQDDKKKKIVENFTIYQFNVDKYVNLWYTKCKEKIKENKYLIMLGMNPYELEEFSKEDKEVEIFMNKLNRINEDPAFLNLIDYEEDNIRWMNAMKEEARERGLKTGFRKGKKLGIEAGKAEGRAEGRVEGRAEGRAEGILFTAKNLLKNGMSLTEVSKNTGLSIENLKSL